MSNLDTTTILQNAEAGIVNWKAICNDSSKMDPLFSANYYFSFPKSSYETWKEYLSGLPEDEQRIHVYLTTDSKTNPTKLSAYMLDSATDSLDPSLESSQSQYNSSLYMSDYQEYNFVGSYNNAAITSVANIDPSAADTRIKRWNDNYTAWLDYQAGQTMTQVFAVPFSDLDAILGGDTSSSGDSVILFFALNTYPVPTLSSSTTANLEVTQSKKLAVEDTFTPEDYYLEFILYQAVDDDSDGQYIDNNFPEDIICPAPPFNNYTGPASKYQLMP